MYIYTVLSDGEIITVSNNIQDAIKDLETMLSISAYEADNEYVHFNVKIETWEI